jgi:transposase-like protein
VAKALHKRKPWDMSRVINTDKAGCYGVAIRELKNEGKMPQDTEHRQVKYLNNIVESDHGKRGRIIKLNPRI